MLYFLYLHNKSIIWIRLSIFPTYRNQFIESVQSNFKDIKYEIRFYEQHVYSCKYSYNCYNDKYLIYNYIIFLYP